MSKSLKRFFQRYVPLSVLHRLDSCSYVAGYRRAKAGRYGPIIYDVGGGMVEKGAVERVIGRSIDDAEIQALQDIVRAEARMAAKKWRQA
jgi:hypothetical protein